MDVVFAAAPDSEPLPSVDAEALEARLAEALARIVDNATCPKYLLEAAEPWLAYRKARP